MGKCSRLCSNPPLQSYVSHNILNLGLNLSRYSYREVYSWPYWRISCFDPELRLHSVRMPGTFVSLLCRYSFQSMPLFSRSLRAVYSLSGFMQELNYPQLNLWYKTVTLKQPNQSTSSLWGHTWYHKERIYHEFSQMLSQVRSLLRSHCQRSRTHSLQSFHTNRSITQCYYHSHPMGFSMLCFRNLILLPKIVTCCRIWRGRIQRTIQTSYRTTL